MAIFEIFVKTAFAVIILFSFSCSSLGQKKPVEAEEDVKETKAQVIWGKNAELITDNITQSRDLSQYEQGGYFDCRGFRLKSEVGDKCNEDEVRNFIWQNWMNKKRAYVRVTYNSVDATSTSHIFIEPNGKGEWRVAWRIVRWHAIPELNNLIHDILGIVAVEQIKDKPEKGKWGLIFKDKSGKTLQKIPYFYE
jgi:hypothetical protein